MRKINNKCKSFKRKMYSKKNNCLFAIVFPKRVLCLMMIRMISFSLQSQVPTERIHLMMTKANYLCPRKYKMQKRNYLKMMKTNLQPLRRWRLTNLQ